MEMNTIIGKTLSLLDQEYPTIVASQSYETIPFNDSSSRIDMTFSIVR